MGALMAQQGRGEVEREGEGQRGLALASLGESGLSPCTRASTGGHGQRRAGLCFYFRPSSGWRREGAHQVVATDPGKGRLGGRGRVQRAQLTTPSPTCPPPAQDAVFWPLLPAAQRSRQVPALLQPGLQGWRTGWVPTEGQGWREGSGVSWAPGLEAPVLVSLQPQYSLWLTQSGFLRVPSDALDSILSPLPLVFWSMTHTHR